MIDALKKDLGTYRILLLRTKKKSTPIEVDAVEGGSKIEDQPRPTLFSFYHFVSLQLPPLHFRRYENATDTPPLRFEISLEEHGSNENKGQHV